MWLNIPFHETPQASQVCDKTKKQHKDESITLWNHTHNCQCNREAWLLSIHPHTPSQLPVWIDKNTGSFVFCKFVEHFDSFHVSNCMWASLVQHCVMQSQFSGFSSLLLNLKHLPSRTQKTLNNLFVTSLGVQFIMGCALNHYKNKTIAMNGPFSKCFLRNQFLEIINPKGEMFCVVWQERNTFSIVVCKVEQNGLQGHETCVSSDVNNKDGINKIM